MRKSAVENLTRGAMLIALFMFLTPVFATVPSQKRSQSVPLMQPDSDTAVVAFIRRSVLMGDGWNYDVWDGDKYVGPLSAGRLLQYRATPGPHLFLLMGRGGHTWTYMNAELAAGKTYFARAYPIPFRLKAADPSTDERVDDWATMTIDKDLTQKKRDKIIAADLPEAQTALSAFRARTGNLDCMMWWEPSKKVIKGVKPAHTTEDCQVHMSAMKPEFGR